jgi:ParB family chromosome partitioning protein
METNLSQGPPPPQPPQRTPFPSQLSELPEPRELEEPREIGEPKEIEPPLQVLDVPLEQVYPNPYQPRKSFEQEALQELADSIKVHGIIQPLVVTKTNQGYELLVGERRLRAAKLAGLASVPVVVKHDVSGEQKLEIALIENIQRRNLNPIEEARAYRRLLDEFKMKQETIAAKVGKSRPAVTNIMRLLTLPSEIQQALEKGSISEGHARALLALRSQEEQLLLFSEIMAGMLTVREVEAKVREMLGRPLRRRKYQPLPPEMQAVENSLRSKFGTNIKIQKRKEGARITIDCYSEEELQALLDRLANSATFSENPASTPPKPFYV